MSRKEFVSRVLKGYYEDKELNIDTLCITVKYVLPIFGECVHEVKDTESGKLIKIIDRDVANCYIAPEGVEVSEEDLDMSTLALVLYTNKEGEINFIEHGYGAFTKANKDAVLFVSSLIGKKLLFDKEN